MIKEVKKEKFELKIICDRILSYQAKNYDTFNIEEVYQIMKMALESLPKDYYVIVDLSGLEGAHYPYNMVDEEWVQKIFKEIVNTNGRRAMSYWICNREKEEVKKLLELRSLYYDDEIIFRDNYETALKEIKEGLGLTECTLKHLEL